MKEIPTKIFKEFQNKYTLYKVWKKGQMHKISNYVDQKPNFFKWCKKAHLHLIIIYHKI